MQDVELVYRERTPGSHARLSARPIHMALIGAPRILCDTDTFVDELHRPPEDKALSCKHCRRIAGAGQFKRADGRNLLALPSADTAYGHKVTVVIPAVLVPKLHRFADSYGMTLAGVLTHGLAMLTAEVAAEPAPSPAAQLGRCRHPGQKFNHPRDAATIDRVCQACHAVIETVRRCSGRRSDGEQCRAFVRGDHAGCSVHSGAVLTNVKNS